MAISLPQRVPQNAPGDFYVEAGLCTQCCLIHGEAPGLLNDPNQPFDECYFRRQPQTPEEVEQAISAVCCSEMKALRYGGTDESVIAKLRSRGEAAQCDHAPEGRAAATRPAPPAVAAPLDAAAPGRARDAAVRLACFAVLWLVAFAVRLAQRGDPRLQAKVQMFAGFLVAAVLVLWLVQRGARYRVPRLLELVAMPFIAGGLAYAAIAVRDFLGSPG